MAEVKIVSSAAWLHEMLDDSEEEEAERREREAELQAERQSPNQPNKMSELVLYDAMCSAIAAAHNVDEAKEIRDKALAIEIYSRQARNIENEKRAREIRIRAERRCGELLRDGNRATGTAGLGRPKLGGNVPVPPNSDTPTLSDLGITKKQSSLWQKLAAVPAEEFEAALAGSRTPSTTAIISKAARPEPGADPRPIKLPGGPHADCVQLEPLTHNWSDNAVASAINRIMTAARAAPDAPKLDAPEWAEAWRWTIMELERWADMLNAAGVRNNEQD
jgi:hypothetical protein